MNDTDNFVSSAEPNTISRMAEALENGEITSRTLAVRLIERHHSVDDTIQSFLKIDEAEVIAEAEASDQRRKSGKSRSRFDGLPIAIKDNISVRGQSCGCASRILEGYTALYDATVITRLKQAGFVCFGRTNMDEFAMGSSTEFSAYLQTRNPWNIDHVPGGSSGGSAAAVSSGQAIAALGSDTGGSIRQPASFCGVVGLKPTYGRVSRYGLVAFASSLDQIGPITADVRDAAILLDILAEHDPRDSTSLPTGNDGFEKALDAVDITSLKLGVPKEYFDCDGLSAEVRSAVEDTVARYEKAGAGIVEVSLPNTKYAVAAYYIIATAEASSNLSRFDGIRYGDRSRDAENLLETYLKTREAGFGLEVKRRIILGTFVLSSGYYDAYYSKAQKLRTLIRQDFENAFEECDVILAPASPTTAFRIGAMSDPLEMYLSDIYTIPVNLAGICAISVPVKVGSDNLPIGVQLIGASMQERSILQAGHWLMQEV